MQIQLLRCLPIYPACRLIWLLPLIAIGLSWARAQEAPTLAVGFSCAFPGSDPEYYEFSVTSDGHASYTSDGKLNRDAVPDERSQMSFTISQAATERIFALAKQSGYFEGAIDFKKKNLASTGVKTLTFRDGQRSTRGTYNYSTIPAVQEITTFFQDLSMTLEFGRRLEYDYRYQKLALDEELKHMEEAANRGVLLELMVDAPVLQKILNDPSVINTVRARAQRLLEHASKPAK